MNGYEAYCVLREAAGLIDEAGLEEGKKTLGKKLSKRGKVDVADNVWNSVHQRTKAAETARNLLDKKIGTSIANNTYEKTDRLLAQRKPYIRTIKRNTPIENAADQYRFYRFMGSK